ncbi:MULTISPECIES: DnaD domain protein [unclassified Gemella]|uniref:DnaD domain protein n=1 Tax=unclassified Gemella TaxID=2624949 RepID=UPI0015CFB0B1|nr:MULTISPECIES: DnaD domain protein [unclassified Gemella]MBF0710837.1 DnaD domain protein [Gemella sp. GL1.1]NYS28181.1 DnaD domain protein [Gemella sp. GL1]
MTNLLEETDFFIVYNDYHNHNFGRELNMLYLPLIGANAIKLYEYLFYKILNDDNMSDTILHFDITENLAINIKQLLLARKKLEALGLLKSYYYNAESEKRYLYEIVKPLSFTEFLSNNLLSELLKNTIGDSAFEAIINKYPSRKVSFSIFTDVSAKFTDIYDSQSPFENETPRLESGPNLSEYYFDFTRLNTILSSKYIDVILENSSLRKEILNLAHLYKVSADDMARGIENSLDKTSAGTDIDIASLKNYLNQLYVNVRKQDVPNLDNMINKQLLKETYSDKKELSQKEKIARELDNINYVEFLNRKHSLKISEIDSRDIILKIQEKYNFTSGVLNVFLDFALRNSNSVGLPSFNYLDKIASSWSNQRLTTALEAIDFANNIMKNRKQRAVQKTKTSINKTTNYNKVTREKTTPEYIKNQMDELLNKVSDKEISNKNNINYEEFLKERGIE